MAKKHAKAKRSNSYNPELREVIAWRIAEGRRSAYPHRGSLTKCAAEFGVSPQQWSQYESGHRSPEDHNLERIAKHLQTTVQNLMTPPENWRIAREEWVADRSIKRRKKATETVQRQTAVEQSRASLGITVGQSFPASVSIHESHSSKTLELIQKLVTVDRLRTEGKISTEDLMSTLKSVDVLIDALCREVTG